jgi:hypothetical protein
MPTMIESSLLVAARILQTQQRQAGGAGAMVESVVAAPSSAVRSRSGFALAPSGLAAILGLSGFKLLLAKWYGGNHGAGSVCRRPSASSLDREAGDRFAGHTGHLSASQPGGKRSFLPASRR